MSKKTQPAIDAILYRDLLDDGFGVFEGRLRARANLDQRGIAFVGKALGDNKVGGSLNDIFSGQGGNDEFDGGGGRDTLFGDTDNDTLMGNTEDDLLFGGDGVDFLRGDGGNDTLRGGEKNDTIEGSAGNNLLKGEGGEDLVFGEVGNDTLTGLAGDTLKGGSGQDVFQFSFLPAKKVKPVVIEDFEPVDRVVILKDRFKRGGAINLGSNLFDRNGNDFFDYRAVRVNNSNTPVTALYFNEKIGTQKSSTPVAIFSNVPGARASALNGLTEAQAGFNIDFNFSREFTPFQRQVIQSAGDRWEQVIKGDLPSQVFEGTVIDDLRIDVSLASIAGSGGVDRNSIRTRSEGRRLPYFADLFFNSAKIAELTNSQFPKDVNNTGNRLFKIALHEIGHALGIGSLWFTDFVKNIGGRYAYRQKGLLASRALEEYNAAVAFRGNTEIPLVQPTGLLKADHWSQSWADERQNGLGYSEIMNPSIPLATSSLTGEYRLSRISAGVLADLGYGVDFSAPFGRLDPHASLSTNNLAP
jgi:hypothetical protein